jgi:hypothetical protein
MTFAFEVGKGDEEKMNFFVPFSYPFSAFGGRDEFCGFNGKGKDLSSPGLDGVPAWEEMAHHFSQWTISSSGLRPGLCTPEGG